MSTKKNNQKTRLPSSWRQTGTTKFIITVKGICLALTSPLVEEFEMVPISTSAASSFEREYP